MINRDEYKNIKRERVEPIYQDEEDLTMPKPTILHIGITAPTYSSNSMVRGWEQLGYRVAFVNWQGLRYEVGIEATRERLLVKAKVEQPELIFLHIQNPDLLDADTLIQLNSIAPTVNFTFDVKTIEKSKWLAEWAKYIDYTFVACQEDADFINKEVGQKKSFVLQSSFDNEFYRPIPKKEGYPKISFQGNKYENTNLEFELAKERQEMINFLYKEFPNDFKAYGIGQENRQTNIHEELSLYCSSDIVISQNNFLRTDYTSDRLWRAVASGAFVLTSWFPGIEKIFVKEVHLDWFKSFDELKELIKFYLDNPEERKEISNMGGQLVRENHTWKNRFETILELVKDTK